MVVPPPMSAFAVELPSPASCVCFYPPPCCGDIAVLLSNGTIAIFQSLAENGVKEEFKPPGKPPKLIGNYRYSKLELFTQRTLHHSTYCLTCHNYNYNSSSFSVIKKQNKRGTIVVCCRMSSRQPWCTLHTQLLSQLRNNTLTFQWWIEQTSLQSRGP